MIVVLPVRDHLDKTIRLVEGLVRDSITVLVYDHGSTDETWEWLTGLPAHITVEPHQADHLGYYETLNHGWERALELLADDHEPPDVGFVTQHTQLPRGAMPTMAQALRASRYATIHPARTEFVGLADPAPPEPANRLEGWCFVVKAELWHRGLRFDENYTIWYGDDDLYQQMRKLDLAPGLASWVHAAHSDLLMLETYPELIGRGGGEDRERFQTKWEPAESIA